MFLIRSCRQKIEELVACVSAPANGETNPDYQVVVVVVCVCVRGVWPLS